MQITCDGVVQDFLLSNLNCRNHSNCELHVCRRTEHTRRPGKPVWAQLSWKSWSDFKCLLFMPIHDSQLCNKAEMMVASYSLNADVEFPRPPIIGFSANLIISSHLLISFLVLSFIVSLMLAAQPFSWMTSPKYFSFSECSIIATLGPNGPTQLSPSQPQLRSWGH